MRLAVALAVALLGVSIEGLPRNNFSDLPVKENNNKDTWVLLVAGSNGYWNYRHQADICHAYHIMLRQGIPANRIVVMMYDDIAYNKLNPTPGIIINKPNGTNVYAGVRIDYKAEDVTPKNFLHILSGDKSAMEDIGTGRVIESDGDDNVFVYFADHGATGMLAFPEDSLMADDLEATLRKMRKENRYKEMFLYIEACESGSMFDNILEENTDVFVMTAAARDESSYAWYCNDNCLGDEFSVKWLEHMDTLNHKESFFHQFQLMRTQVQRSHVQIYGDFHLGWDNGTVKTTNKYSYFKRRDETEIAKSVSSRDAGLHYYKQLVSNTNDINKQHVREQLENIYVGRLAIEKAFLRLINVVVGQEPSLMRVVLEDHLPLSKNVFPCYKKLMSAFKTHCFGHKNEYIFQHLYKLANMCVLDLNVDDVIQQMSQLCHPFKDIVVASVL